MARAGARPMAGFAASKGTGKLLPKAPSKATAKATATAAASVAAKAPALTAAVAAAKSGGMCGGTTAGECRRLDCRRNFVAAEAHGGEKALAIAAMSRALADTGAGESVCQDRSQVQ
ncbi:keratin-associated protein 5-5 [Gracilaria domingensis]|nr:keratin-associated protein 5-5 [Gracilaria domingensis]